LDSFVFVLVHLTGYHLEHKKKKISPKIVATMYRTF